MATINLDMLNENQRAAVVFGVDHDDGPPPLLIIAGAGSGKTMTLAHRVAHLLASGADPRRLLLMTFSRRAAAELTRRVERITAHTMGTGYAAEALTWAGTFHGIGARILREHALSIGLGPEFSIHDREDSADLMNLSRHALGFSEGVADRYTFADIEGMTVIAAQASADSLAETPLRGVLTPTETFENALSINVGGVPVELRTAGFHANDTDVIIHLPEHDFLMAVDTITPGEAPFMNFGATADLEGYMDSFETFLDYDFKLFLSGHVSVLGNRQDVETARDYAHDVRDTVYGLWPEFLDRFMANMELTEFQNGNLAYRMTIEEIRDDCTAEIIDRWQGTLSVVDLWADSHCETVVLYAIMH